MDDFNEDIIETTDVETTPKTTLSDKQYQQVMESAERNRQSEIRSMSASLGTIARQEENKTAVKNALQIDTLDNIIKTTKNIEVDEHGKLYFPEIQTPDDLTPGQAKSYNLLQKQARESMQYVLDKYNDDRKSVGGDIHYIAGSALRSAVDLVAESAALAPQLAGMATQVVGTLGSKNKDNWAVRNGVLLQEWTASRLDDLHQGMTKALNLKPAQTSDIAKETAKLTDTAFQVGAVMAGALAGGAAGAAKATAIAQGRKVSKKVAERYAKQWANAISKKVGKGASAVYATAQTESYLLRPYEGKTREEYLQYLRAKTGGDVLSDIAWATVVGVSNYYLEKAFGAEASIQNFFGDASSGLIKMASRRAAEEGATEIAQDQVLNVADLLRGRISIGEFGEKLFSRETLETFVISSIIGGATATGEYASARSNLVKDYKVNLKKAFPDATEKQLETAANAFINSVEDNVIGKVHQSIIADDQLKNGYGTYHKIVADRINELIDDSVAQGKELAFKDKSPEYQAQFVGSMAQRFTDELYSQAILRGTPINEVFDVTKMDVENGILYMYGAEYGKRPLSQFTKDMTPAQWEKAQIEKRAAEALQKKTKEEQEQKKNALKEARKKEKEEQKRKVSYELSVPYREYLASRNLQETELNDKQAVQQARVMAKEEIRTMPEDNARGVLATLRDDLPVESMTAGEIRQILRSELERFMALQDKESIAPMAKMPSTKARQEQIVRRVRMAKPKSFSEYVRSAGISKDTVEKLGLSGELKKILDKNYRFFVRKNGTISNLEEFTADYQREGDSYQGSVNGFLELLEKDLTTKDIYASDQLAEVELWRERSIRAGKEEEALLADQRDMEIAELTAYLQEKGYDTSAMTDDEILTQGRQMREAEMARMDMIDSDIDFYAIPDNWYQTDKHNGLTTTNSIQAVLRALQSLKNGKALRMLYDTESGNWYLADADERTHIDIFVEAFKQGNYPQLNNVRETEQFFDENYIADEQTLLSFLVQKYETEESTKYVMEKTLGSDEYTHAYLHDNIVVFARNEYDLQDAKFPIESFDHYKIEQELNGNKKVVLEEKATKQNFYQGRKTQMGQRNLAAWNPLRRSIELFSGANETSIAHELSHFWLDNMMLYSRLESATRDTGFAKVWANIKKYLNIDDRQERISESQAEKYTSAYMQYIRNTKIAPVVDLGFKGFDEFIGDISLDYFENAKHREDDGTISSELEIVTPEMVDAFQKLTTVDLNQARDLIATLQDGLPETAIDSQLGEEATPEQMKTATAKQEKETQQKMANTATKNAERDATPTDIPEDSKTQQEAQNRLKSQPVSNPQYAIGTTDEESFAKAREIIAKDRAYAEEIIADDPNGITDGISNSFIALELARQAVQNGKNAMPYLEAFVNGASASGASLRTANLLNTPEFAWAKDMFEASKAKNYALALRMRPAARNAILHRSRIVQTFESKLDEYVEKLFPQLEQAQTYEEQVRIINEWGNNTAKEIGVEPTSEVWGQSVKGTSSKKTEFGKKVVYQKRKLKEFLKSKIGATLTDAEQLKIRQLHTNTIDAMRQLQANPNDIETAKEFIRQARNYQDYLNALAPVGWANALFSSIPRASMLFRISTQVKNTVGTRFEILMSDLNRQLRYGKGNLISKKDMDKEIKKSVEMFLIGGFSPDVQENFFETPVLAWGEKQYSMIARGGDRRGAVFSKERLKQDAKDVAEYAKDNWKNAEGAKKVVVAGRIGVAVAERAMGKAYDVLGYSDAYMKAIIATHETAKACTFYAQAIGKEKGWTADKIKEYANELFADARSYVPKTKLGAEIRKQAVSQAQLETFIKNGTIAEFANRVRAGINLGKESGIGTFISPYVSTAANIMQLGIDYTTGWWRRFDSWKEVKQRIYENAKQGKPIDKADMEYLEKGYRGSYGGLFLLTMLALFKGAQALTGDDDTLDYVPPYSQLSPRERAYYKQVNGGKYNAVKIGDIWVTAEYFGGLSNAITNIGTWYHANSIISAATGLIAETPVIGDLVDQYQKLENDVKYDKDVIDIGMQATLNQAEKYIPGIGKDIFKAIDEGKILYPFLGSSVGLTVSDEAKDVLDVQRESEATYTSISRSKPFNKLSREDKRKLDDEFNKEYIAEAHRWIKMNPNATKEQQKKTLDAIRKKIRNNLKVKYRNLIQ